MNTTDKLKEIMAYVDKDPKMDILIRTNKKEDDNERKEKWFIHLYLNKKDEESIFEPLECNIIHSDGTREQSSILILNNTITLYEAWEDDLDTLLNHLLDYFKGE